jgi:hypothetical protein
MSLQYHAIRARRRSPRGLFPALSRGALAWCIAAVLSARTAHGQEVQISYEAPHVEPPGWGTTLAFGAAGAISAFLLHEAGHIAANLMLGNVPHFQGTKFGGFLPFPVISPSIHCDGDHCFKRNGHSFSTGPNGVYFIVTAGFHVQNITNEILLTSDPNLAEQYAPFRKGLLGFNLFLSALYAAGAYTKLESPNGDLLGAARYSGIHEAWLATLLLVPAVLDGYRYFHPEATWAVWASRAGKATLFGLTFVF